MLGKRAIALILAALVLVPAILWAQDNRGARFQAVPGGGAWVNTTFTPAALTTGRVTVVVRMSEDSVAEARAKTVDHTLALGVAETVAARAHAQHVAAEPYIRAAGGNQLGHFHHAINGVKVEIDRAQLGTLARIPGVVEVLPVRTHTLNNATTMPFIGAPQVWQGVGAFKGEAIKIGIIDTGIDYTHANFGGPGTVAAWNAAVATSTQPPDPTLFGCPTCKVKGGTDLVGDNYNANFNDPAHAPVPDPNPLDCNSHGTHVAGTAAGYGVTRDGHTYTGPYNAAVYAAKPFLIGPGVAPKADIYAIRVFGCAGSTNVVVEAIDWAVAHGMDVISMSLGSDYGEPTDADAVAAANAVNAGLTVVAASGNAGPDVYITSSPASGKGVLSVAADDATAAFPGAALAVTPTGTLRALNSNNAIFSDGAVYPVAVLYKTPGLPSSGVSLGCNPNEYSTATGGTNVTGKLVVTRRGTCARVFRAGAAQHFGGIAAAMINNAAGLPPFEGFIPGGASSPLTGNIYEPVHIPFIGLKGTDAAVAAAATGMTATNTSFANPGFEKLASFSSGGPLLGDSSEKPSITAPGLSVYSSLMGTGFSGAFFSGTSMATPHVAGVAALVREAHSTWPERDQRSAILQTSTLNLTQDYSTRLFGGGVVQPLGATLTQAVVRASNDQLNNLSFGEEEMRRNLRERRELKVVNHGDSPITFSLSTAQASGGPVTVTFDRPTVTVEGHESEEFTVTLSVPTSSVGPTHDPNTGATLFQEISGFVTLTPAAGQNNGVSLELPYYVVPRVRSNAFASTTKSLGPRHPTNTLTVTNADGATSALTDFYSVGLVSHSPSGLTQFDPRAVGLQAFPFANFNTGHPDNLAVFAVNTWTRFNTPDVGEFDICIFTTTAPAPCDNPGVVPDLVVIGASGAAFGFQTNHMVAAVLNPKTRTVVVNFFADAATDNSTALLPVYASDLGLTSASPTFAYTAAAFNRDGVGVQLPGTGKFNAISPSMSVSAFPVVPPDGSAAITVTIDPAGWAATPQKGLMVVVPDNPAGRQQGQIITAHEGHEEGE